MMSGRYLLMLVLSALLAACGGGGGGGNGNTRVDYAPACAALTWSAGPAQALQRMRIDRIESTLAAQVADPELELYVEARYSDEPDSPFLPLPVFMHRDDDGVFLTVPAPLNLENPYAERSFELTLVAGSARCDGPAVEVAGIRPGRGDEVEDYILQTERALVNEASGFVAGASYADLLERREGLVERGELSPQGLLGILIAVDALESFKDETNGLAGGDRELLDAYIAHLDFIGSMQENATRSMSLPVASQSSGNGLRMLPSGSTHRNPVSEAMQRAMSSRSQVIEPRDACGVIQGDPVDIPDAYALQRYMANQKNAEDSLSGVSGAMREAAMAGIPLVSAIVGGPAAAAVGTGVSLLLYIEYTLNAYSRDTLPSKFDYLDINLLPGVEIPEDYELAGKKSFWGGAQVTASSNGHDLTKAAIGALAQALGAARYVKSLGKAAAATAGTKAANVGQRFVQNKVFQKIAELAGGSDCLRVAAAEWKVDVHEERWTNAEVRGGRAFSLGQREPAYQELDLQEIGSSYLVVQVKAEEFSGKTAQADRYISVLEQQLVWKPSAKHVDTPGSIHEFDIEILNTARPDLAPAIQDLSAGVELVSAPAPRGEGVFRVGLKAPADPDQYPATAVASRAAVLEPMSNRVGDVVLFSERRIRIDPSIACVKKNGTLEMAAELSGFGPGEAVDWSVSGGGSVGSVITTEERSAARYQAPGAEAEATVRVQARSDASVFDTAKISVGACDSQMHVWGVLSVWADAGDDISEYDSERDPGISLEDVAPPPSKPTQFWSGRRERFESWETASDTIRNVGIVSADANGSLELISDANGGLVYHHSASQLRDQCWNDPDDGEVNCTNAYSGAGAMIHYYFDLDRPMSIEVSIDGECRSGLDGSIHLTSVIGTVNRYVGDAREPTLPNGLDFTNMIQPNLFTDDAFIPGTIIGGASSPSVPPACADGVYTYSRQLDLVGPIKQGEKDLVIVYLAITSALSNLENLQEERSVGGHQGEADFRYSIRVQQK